jgi:phosphoserine phosphatase
MAGGRSPVKLVCFDCDSTLSAVEGIDELARASGPQTFARIEAMTADAMDGRLPLEDIFARRLEIIRPSREAIAAVGRRYVETVEPTAAAAISDLVASGWTPAIVSAGYRQAIRPLADHLGIGRVEAVDLYFEADGSYRGFDTANPCTRSEGKAEVIERLKGDLRPGRVVTVGDGVSDLETKPSVDLFVGYGRYVARERVRREAAVFIRSLSELPQLLAGL